MIKSIFAAVAATPFMAAAAVAGPYVNIETNAGWAGDDYVGATTDLHLGYQDSVSDNVGYYVQAGPAIVAADGEDTDTRFSGKGGLNVAATDQLGFYGEVSFLTDINADDDLGLGGKLGVKYTF